MKNKDPEMVIGDCLDSPNIWFERKDMPKEKDQEIGDLLALPSNKRMTNTQNKKLAAALNQRNDIDYQNNDIHQSILNTCFDEWNCRTNYSYAEIVDWMEQEYGKLAAFAVLVGKYNQQVENGGHEQYFNNGYASGNYELTEAGYCPLHEKMKELFHYLSFDLDEEGKSVYNIVKSFELDHSEDDDDETRITGWFVVDSGRLDREYYKVNKKWMEYFNSFLIEELVISFVIEKVTEEYKQDRSVIETARNLSEKNRREKFSKEELDELYAWLFDRVYNKWDPRSNDFLERWPYDNAVRTMCFAALNAHKKIGNK